MILIWNSFQLFEIVFRKIRKGLIMFTIDFNRKVDNNDDDGEPQKEKDYHHDMKVKAENQEPLAKLEKIKLEKLGNTEKSDDFLEY